MKKCLKCNKEYEDSDNFCPRCGEKLVQTNVCQKCGHPVATEDIFCRHCGHKIEKEYRCEKCNAIIPEGAKFCPECGNNIANPVVSITTTGKVQTSKPKAEKILSYAISGVSLLLFLLILIGCFGDLSVSFYRYSGVTSNSSIVSVKYFFGEAFKNYSKQMESVQFEGYSSVACIEIIVKYAFWVLAIGSAIFGIIRSSIGLFKTYKNNEASDKKSIASIAAFGAVPYLAIIALTSGIRVIGSNGADRIEYGTSFGWGTTMIFVSLIVHVVAIAVDRLIRSILRKDAIVEESILCGIKIALSVVFFISFGQVISIFYNVSGANITGYATTYTLVLNNLYYFSTGASMTFSIECILMLVAIGLILAGTVFGIIFLLELFDFKKMIPIYILGSLMVAFLLTGYIMSIVSINNYAKQYAAVSGVPSDALGISAIGIVFVALSIVSVAGLAITKAILKNRNNLGGTN